MRLSDIKIGEKFFHLDKENKSDKLYLRIDMNPSAMFKHMQLPSNTVAALDLTTCKVMCLNGNYEVEVEHDNAYI